YALTPPFPTYSLTPRLQHPFPTRRSSDLFGTQLNAEHAFINPAMILLYIPDRRAENVVLSIPNPPENWRAASATGIESPGGARTDRKSTRLNSSHGSISYAVFCLKKKTHN